MKRCLLIILLAAASFAEDAPLGSADWVPTRHHPFGWRGDGTGRFPGATPPLHWCVEKNIRWSAQVGTTYSSPILTARHILVLAEPNWLICMDRASGQIAWKLQIAPPLLADEPARKAAADYQPPKDGAGMTAATPVTDGKSIYCVLANGIVCAISIEGKVRWTRHIDAPQSTGYGRSASPLLTGDRLIVHMTNLHAFDPDSGNQFWVNDQAKSGYGTPAPARANDTDLIVTPEGDVVRVTDGKLLASDICHASRASVLASGDKLYFADNALSALRIGDRFKEKDLFAAELRGETFATPLLHEGLLYALNAKGELFIFDTTAKGDTEPVSDPRSLFPAVAGITPASYASPTFAGKHLFLHSTSGETIIVEATRQAKEVTRNNLPTGTGANPIFSGKQLFLRDGEKLLCIQE